MPSEASKETFRPVAERERYVQIDVLRGLALFGVLLVNLLTLFRVSLAAHILRQDAPADRFGQAFVWVLSTLIEFKAFTLFSLLFGVGIAIQAERAARRRNVEAFLLRRFFVLLVIGVIHMVLIWNGDILTLYAVCGILLLPLLRLPAGIIAAVGVLLVIGSSYYNFPISFPRPGYLQTQAAAATVGYAHYGFQRLIAFRWYETKTLIFPLLGLTLPRTLGVILLGVSAWRAGLITGHRRLIATILVVALAGATVGIGLDVEWASTVLLAFAYAAAVLLWTPGWPLLRAGGQMAFTNYLSQSVILSLVFYGYGLGQFGRLDLFPCIILAIVIYTAQLLFSRWWLGHFYFGPLEWLWRSLTYGRGQPVVKSAIMLSHREARITTVFVLLIAVPLVHVGLPWKIGRAGPHWGWTVDAPGRANLAGLSLAVLALALIVWIVVTMLREIPSMPAQVALGLRPSRLMQTGPYAWTRHPMYWAELLLWLSVAAYFGSFRVLIVAAGVAALLILFILPREERALDSHFGDEYRSYRSRVPAVPGISSRRS